MPGRRLPPVLRSLLTGLAVVVAVIIYAYGVEVTQVDLEETQKPERLTQLVRIVRALANPDLLTYEYTEKVVRAPFMLPCPDAGFTPPPPDTSGPYIVVTPACAGEREEITVEGFAFEANTEGPVDFIPPSNVRLQMGAVKTDSDGHFLVTVKTPRRPTAELQNVQVTLRARVGGPEFSRSANDTWDKIIETVFLALLATTIGIALAIPISFFAASNLMRPITSPMITLLLTLLAVPIGAYLGAIAVGYVGGWGLDVGRNALMGVGGLVVSPLVVWQAARWALPQEELSPPKSFVRLIRGLVLLGAAVVTVFGLGVLAAMGKSFGAYLQPKLGPFGFLGFFVFTLSDAVGLFMPVVGALVGAFVLISLAGALGEFSRTRLSSPLKKTAAIVVAGLTGAAYFGLIGAGIGWVYQLENPQSYVWTPALVGGLLGLAAGAALKPDAAVPIGTAIYYLTRTILNLLRAIEPLIYVIVFAVWVSIGPFAGMLALALHTIAALGKLYSEQVESILAGPLEAIQATGATRLQTVVYAVVPQIIPPYISFTMYRWDINVRMSTIIGFAGGGGIGFLLQQNINLLQYRAAAVQMLAIAIVVMIMDYLSATMREKVI